MGFLKGAFQGGAEAGQQGNSLSRMFQVDPNMSTMDRIGTGLNRIATMGGAEAGYQSGMGIPGLQGMFQPRQKAPIYVPPAGMNTNVLQGLNIPQLTQADVQRVAPNLDLIRSSINYGRM